MLTARAQNPGSTPSPKRSSTFAGNSGADSRICDGILQLLKKLKALPADEWEARVAAMQKLEPLIENASLNYGGNLADILAPMNAALKEQMLDRRSLVSKQACRTTTAVAEAFGIGYEPYAFSMMPTFFKAEAMGINPVTEAVHQCARSVISNCPSGRLLMPLHHLLKHDKNVKLRLAASEYMLQALEEWEPSVYEPQLNEVQECIRIAATDAGAATRGVGRSMFVAFAHQNTGDAAILLTKIPDTDRSLKTKLVEEAVKAGIPLNVIQTSPKTSITSLSRVSSSRTSSRRLSSDSLPPALSMQRAMSAAGPTTPKAAQQLSLSSLSLKPTDRGELIRQQGDISAGPSRVASMTPRVPVRPASAPATSPAVPARQPSLSRTNTAVTPRAGRTATAASPPTAKPPVARISTLRPAAGGALRVAAPTPASKTAMATSPPPTTTRRVPPAGGAMRVPAAVRVPSSPSVMSPKARITAASPKTPTTPMADMSIEQVLDGFARPGIDWMKKVRMYDKLRALVNEDAAAAEEELLDEEDRFPKILCDGMGDAHVKVSTAALTTTEAIAQHCGGALEPHLERLMPMLFSRTTDPKDPIRAKAVMTLLHIAAQQQPELIFSAISRSLDVNRTPKVKVSTLEYLAKYLSKQLLPGSTPGLRPLVQRCLALARDKSTEIRKPAMAAVAAAKRLDHSLVDAEVDDLPTSPQMHLRRALSNADALVPSPLHLPAVGSSSSSEVSRPGTPSHNGSIGEPIAEVSYSTMEYEGSRTPSTDTNEELDADRVAHELGAHNAGKRSASQSPPASECDGAAATVRPARAPAASPGGTLSLRASIQPPSDALVDSVIQVIEQVPDAASLTEIQRLLPLMREDQLAVDVPRLVRALHRIVLGDDPQHMRALVADTLVFVATKVKVPVAESMTLMSCFMELNGDDDEGISDCACTGLHNYLNTGDVPSMIAIRVLMKYLPPKSRLSDSQILVSLFHLEAIIQQVSEDDLHRTMPELFPLLCNCFASPHADIRKLATATAVCCWQTLKTEGMKSYLAKLSTAQMKLLTIHYERACKA